MHAPRRRWTRVLAVLAVLGALLAPPAGAFASDSPEAALHELLDRAESGVLGVTAGPSPGAEEGDARRGAPASEPGEADTVCGVLSLDELNALTTLEYEEVSGEGDACLFSSYSEEQGFHSLQLYTEVLDLELLEEVFPEGSSMAVAGRPAYTDGTSLWIDLGERVLTVLPVFFGSPLGEGVDAIDYAVEVAELVVPRLLGAADPPAG